MQRVSHANHTVQTRCSHGAGANAGIHARGQIRPHNVLSKYFDGWTQIYGSCSNCDASHRKQ